MTRFTLSAVWDGSQSQSFLILLISFLLSLAQLSCLDSFHEYLIKTQLSDKSKGDIYLISSIEIISQYSPEIIWAHSTAHQSKGSWFLLGLNGFDISSQPMSILKIYLLQQKVALSFNLKDFYKLSISPLLSPHNIQITFQKYKIPVSFISWSI